MKQSFVLVMSLDSLVKEKNVKVLWITSILILVTIFIKINMTHFFLNS